MAEMAPAAAKAEAALSELIEAMEQGDACMEPATVERLLELTAAATKRLTAASTRGGGGPEQGSGESAVFRHLSSPSVSMVELTAATLSASDVASRSRAVKSRVSYTVSC